MTRRSRAETDENPAAISWFFIWGAAIIFQYLSQFEWILTVRNAPHSASSILESLVVLSAAAVLLFPRRVVPIIAMAALQICASLVRLPDIPNHRLFTMFVNLAILLGFLKTWLSKEKLSSGSFWFHIAPSVRCCTVLLYIFAALAKTNSGYLATPTSCATIFASETRQFLNLDWLGQDPVIIGSLLFEWTLPILLLLKGTRRDGVLAGLIFHLVLSFDRTRHFLDFSSVMTAMLLSFRAPLPISARDIKMLGRMIVGGAALCVWYGGSHPEITPVVQFGIIRDDLWLLFAGAMIGSYILFRSATPEPDPPRIRPTGAVMWLPVLLVLLNGATPYLGLKTKSSWDMYSNLRLEGPHPNHLLFGGGLDLLGEMREPATVTSSTNPELRSLAGLGLDILPFELQRIFDSDPAGFTSFVWKGAAYENRPHTRPIDPLAQHWLLKKLFWFRPVDRQTPPRCQR